ncbi:MAG: hypothetical protein LBH82_01780 [Bacteroidales bacterium]|jgi:hypothetical protein|nr:hypothetical protein [Bacteroidales bacterium]
MKKVFFLIATMAITSVSIAQTAQERSIPFDKNNSYSGVSLDVSDYDVKTIAGALQSRFEISGLKGSNSGKFRAYLAQNFPEFGTQNYDIYTQVVEVGKKKEKKTMVYLLVSKGNNNFVTPSSDPDIVNNMKTYLNGFTAYLKQYDTSLKIAEQQKNLAKMEKEFKSLTANKEKLQKQLDKTDTEIQQKQDLINKAKELLNSLKSTN